MFSAIATLFTTVFTEPLFNALVFFYNTIAVQDFGLAVIYLTAAIRIILWPLSHKALTSQKNLQELQPKIKEIKKKHKDDQEAQAKALMELYKGRGANPLGGCLPMLVQIPILFALYRVFLGGVDPAFLTDHLYSFIANPGVLHTTLLGLVDLSERSILLAVIAGGLQFMQSRMMMKNTGSAGSADNATAAAAQRMSKQVMYFLPGITIVISLTLPAALPLYWIVTTLFTIAQQFVTMRSTDGDTKRGNNPTHS